MDGPESLTVARCAWAMAVGCACCLSRDMPTLARAVTLFTVDSVIDTECDTERVGGSGAVWSALALDGAPCVDPLRR